MYVPNMRFALSVTRKLLQVGTGSLDLSGSGVSAGDSVVGASAEAYGHGVLDAESLQDNHIEVSFQNKTLKHWSLQLRIQHCTYRPPLLMNAMSSFESSHSSYTRIFSSMYMLAASRHTLSTVTETLVFSERPCNQNGMPLGWSCQQNHGRKPGIMPSSTSILSHV